MTKQNVSGAVPRSSGAAGHTVQGALRLERGADRHAPELDNPFADGFRKPGAGGPGRSSFAITPTGSRSPSCTVGVTQELPDKVDYGIDIDQNDDRGFPVIRRCSLLRPAGCEGRRPSRREEPPREAGRQ